MRTNRLSASPLDQTCGILRGQDIESLLVLPAARLTGQSQKTLIEDVIANRLHSRLQCHVHLGRKHDVIVLKTVLPTLAASIDRLYEDRAVVFENATTLNAMSCERAACHLLQRTLGTTNRPTMSLSKMRSNRRSVDAVRLELA